MNKIRSYFAVLALLFASISYAQLISVVEVDHGVYEVIVDHKESAEKTLTQTYNLLKSQKLVQRTDTVFANIGKTFGVEFTLKSFDNVNHVVPLQIVWEFPKPMTNPFTHKVYTESIMDQYFITGNGSNFHSYTLEYDYEFVEGWWTFKIVQGKNVIYKKQFLLINLL